jgi:hypothetical protein
VIARGHAIVPALSAFARGVAAWSDLATGRGVDGVADGSGVEILPRA